MKFSPQVFELSCDLDPLFAFTRLAEWDNVIFFASTRSDTKLGRYSFLAAEPVDLYQHPTTAIGRQLQPFHDLQHRLASCQVATIPELPPFQGGAAGLLTYELGRCWEKLPTPAHDEFQLPAMMIGIYQWVVAWDHQQRKCWLIVQNHSARQAAALQQRLQTQFADADKVSDPSTLRHRESTDTFSMQTPLHPVGNLPGLTSNFSHGGYLHAVQQVIDYIHAGDIFQANLSQRLVLPTSHSPIENFLALATHNPAPFAGYMAGDDWAVISSSPERFIQVADREVSTRPIKGTRQRHFIPEADLYARDELRESAKDRAENVMIVDLLRNDLSRVCQPGSIKVPELCTIESYQTVTHLVSEVRGKLREDATFWDLVAATFPGGSITGAPKIRAMEIITELEQVARGPYCGSLFYHGFDGTADSSILIRTMTQRGGWLQLPVGGGIVAQSIPEQEYQETLHKANGMLQALKSLKPAD